MNFIREIAEQCEIKEGGRTLGEILAIHPEFKAILEELETHWLGEANKILTEIITEIRNRISSPDTTMGDLVKALDTISNKYNLHLGKPTSLSASANINYVKNLSDEELDKRIKDLEGHFLSAPQTLSHHQHASLLTVDISPQESGTPPLPLSETCEEGSKKKNGRRRIVMEEKRDEHGVSTAKGETNLFV